MWGHSGSFQAECGGLALSLPATEANTYAGHSVHSLIQSLTRSGTLCHVLVKDSVWKREKRGLQLRVRYFTLLMTV